MPPRNCMTIKSKTHKETRPLHQIGAQPRFKMSVTKLFEPLALSHGPAMKNRFMLAPLTNHQSHPDGRLSEDEYRWLTRRAEGGFALTTTCALHIQQVGQGFPGQLGIFGDQHLEGLSRLAGGIKARGSVAAAQLYHSGNRRPRNWSPIRCVHRTICKVAPAV
jgi:2,4-dienoyl-CoA reductase-like NADH-dependent reductase (Old Yellow Enzyme family)